MGNLELLEKQLEELDSLTIKDERIKHVLTFEGWTLSTIMEAANKYRTECKHPENGLPFYRCRFTFKNVEVYLKSTKFQINTTFSPVRENA